MSVVVWYRSRLVCGLITDWRRSVPMTWDDARALVDRWRSADRQAELEIHTAPFAGDRSPPLAQA